MSKIRINDLARELEVKSKAILDALTAVGVTEKKTHSSSIEEHEAVLVRKYFRSHADEASSVLEVVSRQPAPKTKSRRRSICRTSPVRETCLRAIQQKTKPCKRPRLVR